MWLCRKEQKQCLDFSSGFAVFSATRDKVGPDGKVIEFITLLPLDAFLSYFASPSSLAEVLEVESEKLARRWNKMNEFLGRGDKIPDSWAQPMHTFSWPSGGGQMGKTIVEISLNTYSFTGDNQNTDCPHITPSDMKVRTFSVCI